jgi:glycosyltransferase involved in cell wall biosynthesis
MTNNLRDNQPPVTIILPTLNEIDFIQSCLESLVAQDYPDIAEILVVDGGSIDGTRDLIVTFGGKVRLVDNPGVIAAAAMNTGIGIMNTEIFVRADAHALYATDYVRCSVEAYSSNNAAVAGGPMRPLGTTPFGRAVAAVTTSPFGVGPGKFHYSEKLQEVDTVYLGTFNRKAVLAVGGFDEVNLHRGLGEDQELNFRIRRAGGRIILDPRIHSTYFPRSTPTSLARQYHHYGICKVSTLAKHKTLPYWRPLVPAAMVLGSCLWVILSISLGYVNFAATPFILYAAAALVIGLKLKKGSGVNALRSALALTICHWCYGAGFWRGIFRVATFRKFGTQSTFRSY